MRSEATVHIARWALTLSMAVLASALLAEAQTNSSERVFPQSKAEIEKALKTMQSNLSGRLPVLEGFANPGEHPLDQYRRGYYQVTVQVSPAGAGKSMVRVSTKVTAWYRDAATSRSGYQLLTSNGRIESDLLDQLAEQLGENASNAAGSNQESANAAAPPVHEPSGARVQPRAGDFDAFGGTADWKRILLLAEPKPSGPGRPEYANSGAAPKCCKGRRSPAGRGCQSGRDTQESGAAQESGGGEEIRHCGGRIAESDCESSVSGEHA